MTSEAPESRCSGVPLDVRTTLHTFPHRAFAREGRKKTTSEGPGEVVYTGHDLSVALVPNPLARPSGKAAR